ncbi:Hormone-sensitive lipase [Diaporthe eres]|uniref:Alpha/beta hydrolase fold-3 domain-containing protein n=1 Tax=Diaporthe vaccinii TaxID=105482 RepID=A0ABR4EE97_9PEZI|nr:Hormone-sensitive lipase [Diaporthe eres]
MELDHRTGRSIYSVVLQALMRPFKPHLVAPKRTFPAGSPRLEYDKKIRGGVRVAERQQEDIWLYDLVVAHHKDGDGDNDNKNKKPAANRKRMYYIAGGGWQSPPSGQHWKFCAEVARKVPGLVVTIVSAPLAPASPAATTLPALRRLFASVLGRGSGRDDDGEQVILAGDSSGANIVLSLALDALRNSKGEEDGAGTRQPMTLLIISPAVDLRPMEAAAGETRVLAGKDPVLTVGSHNSEAAAWAQEMDRTDVCISPVMADVGILAAAGVRLVGVTGGHDMLTPAALGFRDECAGRGVSGAWLHWEGQMHCFPLAFMYGLPEALRAKDWVVEQIRGL